MPAIAKKVTAIKSEAPKYPAGKVKKSKGKTAKESKKLVKQQQKKAISDKVSIYSLHLLIKS